MAGRDMKLVTFDFKFLHSQQWQEKNWVLLFHSTLNFLKYLYEDSSLETSSASSDSKPPGV